YPDQRALHAHSHNAAPLPKPDLPDPHPDTDQPPPNPQPEPPAPNPQPEQPEPPVNPAPPQDPPAPPQLPERPDPNHQVDIDTGQDDAPGDNGAVAVAAEAKPPSALEQFLTKIGLAKGPATDTDKDSKDSEDVTTRDREPRNETEEEKKEREEREEKEKEAKEKTGKHRADDKARADEPREPFTPESKTEVAQER
ncbi:MAG: hypothetical protein Q4D83_08145, partial [Corynebacterium sp.]|nr:hypothetical protein [Corynebacterium sp.]